MCSPVKEQMDWVFPLFYQPTREQWPSLPLTNQSTDSPGTPSSLLIREYMDQELPYHHQPKLRVQWSRTRNSFISIFVFIRWPKYSIIITNQRADGPVTSRLYQRTDGPEIPSLPPTNQRADSPRTLPSPPTREQKAQILLISTYQSTRDLCVTCSLLSPQGHLHVEEHLCLSDFPPE